MLIIIYINVVQSEAVGKLSSDEGVNYGKYILLEKYNTKKELNFGEIIIYYLFLLFFTI